MPNSGVPSERLRSIHRMGKLACSTLAPGSRGRILAANSSAIYLLSENQELLWLATEHAALHRRGLHVVGSLPQESPETSHAIVGRRLGLGPQLAFDLSDASVWDVAPMYLERFLPLRRLPAYLAAAFPLLTSLPSPAGFGILLPAILGRIDNHLNSPLVIESACAPHRAWPAIRRVLDACLAGDLPAALVLAEELVGVGEGLTPSGDDFVGGLLYSLQRLRVVHASLSRLEPQDLNHFLRSSKSRTNLISYTMLQDHAFGHSSDALQLFVDGLLNGMPHEHIEPLATRLIRIGHTTGWDLLTGVAVGMMSTRGGLAVREPGQVGAACLLQS